MQKVIIANWKMNPSTLKEAERLFNNTIKAVSGVKKIGIVICPPFVYLQSLKSLLSAKSHQPKASLGGQNLFWEDTGAYTGEISGEMLYSVGAKYVIVGHSERRAKGENNLEVNKKIKTAVKSGLTPIVCIGENLRDENHEYLNFIKKQIEECLDKIPKDFLQKIIIAYEPIWAIGKGALPATAEEFREMKIFIKKVLSDKFKTQTMGNVRIIYGGSVDEKNVQDFIENGQADGFLVGRASLNPKKFGEIIKICEALNN